MKKLKSFTKYYKKFERIIGGMKFAVVIISLFTVALTYGTIVESYHGADYANRLVYKSLWFIGIQVAMLLSIIMATTIRLPLKKRLYGFYVIHSGLIILFLGSFVTYKAGIDGIMQLEPNSPSNQIFINEDVLRIEADNRVLNYNLPYNAGITTLSDTIDNIKILEYYPSADEKIVWKKSKNESSESGRYLIYNDDRGFSQEIAMSLDPDSIFKSTGKLGPLNIHYMPNKLSKCFKLNSKSGYIVWNAASDECFTPESKKIEIAKTADKGKDFFAFKHKGQWIGFVPSDSPIAVDKFNRKRADLPFRVFDRNKFIGEPNLFIFGKSVSYYQDKSWVVSEFKDNIVQIPWMDLKVRLIDTKKGHYPSKQTYYIKPIQQNNEIISGEMKAVKVEIEGISHFVTTDTPLIVMTSKGKRSLFLTSKSISLPYQLNLNKFVMKNDPGTNKAASYESFISLLDGRNDLGSRDHHIFMNNPLKYDGFTFYQSSYYEVSPSNYATILSVNFDPGRPIKYFGSLLLILGTIWHYMIMRKRKRK